MSGPLFFVHPSQFLDFKEVLLNDSVRLFSRIEIENIAQTKIAYRIRTNAKDVYTVKHNPGFVEKDLKSEVLIFVKPGKVINARHRFVVTVAECKDDSADRKDFWKNRDGNDKLAHWKLSVRVPTMDTETTMSMYQQQVKALKIENQMLRNKCDVMLAAGKEIVGSEAGSGETTPFYNQKIDTSTVFLMSFVAILLSQIIIYVFRVI
ncbi:unnamed protein product [Bursaphelenchus xylophilus]|uniref:Major sperm protein n=1 Tax=Bursaphelenchus xylophilus TaxID=6326 RepID=A0A1I7RRS3_BURXY|nr:unnamed protein product [Bursaphelenchus xylophilus]CAG9123510.1 unnamed protein product [Bursaphelenchus xylophilus]